MGHAAEVARGERFEFGANWARFLSSVTDERIREAEQSLLTPLSVDLRDKTFCDIGSGSGLFSLAAHRLGASVLSFDYDPASVACTNALKQRYGSRDRSWQVSAGSILDPDFTASLGAFDVVYSWGVLHHTGDLWTALANALALVKPGGYCFIALYNDNGLSARAWTKVKRLYCRLPRALRFLVLLPAAAWLWIPALLRDALTLHPFRSWRNYDRTRGMSPWRDVVDWVGGFPYQPSKPETVFDFCRLRGFNLQHLTTTTGLGCNEFVFRKDPIPR